jgi:prepilin-type N-terminal cleavage/methylation domain-containing protein
MEDMKTNLLRVLVVVGVVIFGCLVYGIIGYWPDVAEALSSSDRRAVVAADIGWPAIVAWFASLAALMAFLVVYVARVVRRPSRRGAMASRHSGFTLIEVLVVIGVLALLIAITMIGLRSVQATTRGKETRARMAVVRSVIAERDRVAELIDLSNGVQVAAPGDVRLETGASDRHGSQAADFSGKMMAQAVGVPAAAKIIGNLPAGETEKWTATPTGQRLHVLDGWGNPIIIVPGAFLPKEKVIYPVGYVPPPALSGGGVNVLDSSGSVVKTIKSTGGGWFTMSAGPDGVFFRVKGSGASAVVECDGDNLYSFEK